MAVPIPDDHCVHCGHGSAASGRLCSCWPTDPVGVGARQGNALTGKDTQ